jgi:hypothetical protein
VAARRLLTHGLRDNLGLTGTRIGCDTSRCRAYTIAVDGDAVKSCIVLAVTADGAEITTIEGLATGNTPYVAFPRHLPRPAPPRPKVSLQPHRTARWRSRAIALRQASPRCCSLPEPSPPLPRHLLSRSSAVLRPHGSPASERSTRTTREPRLIGCEARRPQPLLKRKRERLA